MSICQNVSYLVAVDQCEQLGLQLCSPQQLTTCCLSCGASHSESVSARSSATVLDRQLSPSRSVWSSFACDPAHNQFVLVASWSLWTVDLAVMAYLCFGVCIARLLYRLRRNLRRCWIFCFGEDASYVTLGDKSDLEGAFSSPMSSQYSSPMSSQGPGSHKVSQKGSHKVMSPGSGEALSPDALMRRDERRDLSSMMNAAATQKTTTKTTPMTTPKTTPMTTPKGGGAPTPAPALTPPKLNTGLAEPATSQRTGSEHNSDRDFLALGRSPSGGKGRRGAGGGGSLVALVEEGSLVTATTPPPPPPRSKPKAGGPIVPAAASREATSKTALMEKQQAAQEAAARAREERAAKEAAQRREAKEKAKEAAEMEAFQRARKAAEDATSREEGAAEVAKAARKAYRTLDRVKVALRWADAPIDAPPEYLALGITVGGLQAWVDGLPADAPEQFLHTTPDFYATGDFGYANPGARVLDGYVSRHFLEQRCSQDDEGYSYCERLQTKNPKAVGPASVIVSCPRRTKMVTLIDALESFLRYHKLPRETTCFWLFDLCVRLNERGLRAAQKHVEFVHAEVGRTVMLLDPWHEPHALRRANCLCEAVQTYRTGTSVLGVTTIANRFELVMASEQRTTFEWALHHRFEAVEALLARISKLDLRTAEFRRRADRERLLRRLATNGGSLAEANEHAKILLRRAILQHGRRALARLPLEERKTSNLIPHLGLMYKHVEVALVRERYGARHPESLNASNELAYLLKSQGKVEAAAELYESTLKVRRETLGSGHQSTLISMNNLAVAKYAQGDIDAAKTLFKECLAGRRSKLGKHHPSTLAAYSSLGNLYRYRGELAAATPLLREALAGRRASLGNGHEDTIKSMNNLGNVLFEQSGEAGERSAAQTELLEEAETLYREALATCSVLLGTGPKHSLEALRLVCINNLGCLLQATGHAWDTEEAAVLLRQGLLGSKETLGEHHLDTLISSSNLGALLRKKGEAEEASKLIRDAFVGLAHAKKTLGVSHPSVQYVGEGLRKQRREPVLALMPPHELEEIEEAQISLEEIEAPTGVGSPNSAEVSAAPTLEELRLLMRPIFDEFDQDRSGSIDARELQRVVTAARILLSEEQLAALLAKADADRTGTIEFDEFVGALAAQLAAGEGDLARVVNEAGSTFGWLNPFSWFAPSPSSAPAELDAAALATPLPPMALHQPSSSEKATAASTFPVDEYTDVHADSPAPRAAVLDTALDKGGSPPSGASASTSSTSAAAAAAVASASASSASDAASSSSAAAFAAAIAPSSPTRPSVPSLSLHALPLPEVEIQSAQIDAEQKRIDAAADMVASLSVDELIEQLAEAGIVTTGSRSHLAERMLEYLLGGNVDSINKRASIVV